jgi:RNA polymerase-binding transcription factor DksA
MTDTTPFKARLEAEKATLEAELATLGRRNPSNPNDWEVAAPETEQAADPNDRATQLGDLSDDAAILNDLELRYADVNSALARIEDGSYGTCETGGEAIEEARLNADPAARTCKVHLT